MLYGTNPDPEQARYQLENAQADVNRFVRERLPGWFKNDNESIAGIRALLPG